MALNVAALTERVGQLVDSQKEQSEDYRKIVDVQWGQNQLIIEAQQQINFAIKAIPDCITCEAAEGVSKLRTDLEAVVKEKIDPLVADKNFQRGVRRIAFAVVAIFMVMAGALADDLGRLIANSAQTIWHWWTGQ